MDVPSVQVPNFGYNPIPTSAYAQQAASIGNLNAEQDLRQQKLQQSQFALQQQQQTATRANQARQVISQQIQNGATPDETYKALAQVDPEYAQQFRQSETFNQFLQQRGQDFAAQGQERLQQLASAHQQEIQQHTNAISGLAHGILNDTLLNAGTFVSGFNPNGTSIHTQNPQSNNYQGIKYYPNLSTPEQVQDTRQHVQNLIQMAQMSGVGAQMLGKDGIPPIEDYDQNPQQYMQNLYNETKGWYNINQNAPGTIKAQQEATKEQQGAQERAATLAETTRHNKAEEGLKQKETTPNTEGFTKSDETTVQKLVGGRTSPLNKVDLALNQLNTAKAILNKPTITQGEYGDALKLASTAMGIGAGTPGGETNLYQAINEHVQQLMSAPKNNLSPAMKTQELDHLSTMTSSLKDWANSTLDNNETALTAGAKESDRWQKLRTKYSTTAQPATAQTLTPKDQQAINWARSNVSNPKFAAQAKQILQLHGM